MRTFARHAGIPCRSANPLPELAGFDCGERRRLAAAEVEASINMQLEGFPLALGRLPAELGSDASPPMGSKHSWAGRAWRRGGDTPIGGYQRLAAAMATGVDLRLGVDVAEVAWSASGVRVRSVDGTSEEGSHAVVTVPLGVLKRVLCASGPHCHLVGWRRSNGSGSGAMRRWPLRFDEQFWRAAGLPHVISSRDPAAPAVWAIGQDAFGAGPVLAFQIFHSAASRILGAAPDDAAQWALGLLAQATGSSCPPPAAVAVTSWANDPYSGGSYTHIAPGANPADADLLGEPIAGRLLFAGEHTQSARLASADGAMTSGIREAKRLLGQPSVRLGPTSPHIGET